MAQELTPLGTVDYTYDKLGRRATMMVAGEPTVTYTYDDASRLININRSINGTSKDYMLTYDNGGRRTKLQIPLYKSGGSWKYDTTTYGYDIANRLLSMAIQGPSAQIENLTYVYDPNGNRTSFTRTATQPMASAITGTNYDEANEMLAYNGNTLAYDNNGNMTSDGTKTYTWDARNRLTSISGAVTASFSYDAQNRRISKTISGTTTQYIYDGVDIIQEIKSGVKTNYVRTLNIDEPLSRITGSTVRHYVTDALGSVIALTDDTGAVKTTYTYDAFGSTTVSGEASDNPFQYTGRENDGTGLYYYRARYYSPEMQRFISEDPIRRLGGINYYSYVKNNPTKYKDPYGYAECTDCHKSDPGNQGEYPPGVPAGPACNAYLACGRIDLYLVCQVMPNDGWSACVRKCLLNRWHNCKYDNGFWNDHDDCWRNVCKKNEKKKCNN